MESTVIPGGEDRIRVLVVDSNRIHTQLLAEALQRDPGLQVVGCSSAEALLEANRHPTQVAVLSADLDNEPTRGFELLRQLRAMHPTISGIMLLDCMNREMILESFRAGTRGLFSRSESVETLAKCVRCVYDGHVWANSEQMRYAVEALASSPIVRATNANGFSLLSIRELEVVRSLAEGLTNREIAERLGLSQHTVKNYLFKIFEKMGVSNRIELLFMTLSQAGTPVSARPGGKTENSETPDHGEALAVYKQRAEQGYPGAQAQLARKSRDGIGMPRDLVSAYMWFLICEESSQKMKDEVAAERKALAAQMDPKHLANAETKAREYLKKLRKMPGRDIGKHLAQVAGLGACILFASFLTFI
jgi:two-component system nitrate/nitrite response regulator NarL